MEAFPINELKMKNATFVDLCPVHEIPVMEIFNYYVLNSYAAYPDKKLPYSYFNEFLNMTKGYPAKVVEYESKIIGFGFLRPYKPFSTFRTTAEITYFIDHNFKGQGLGSQMLAILEDEGQKMGIKAIFASIVSLNAESLIFHQHKGFKQVGLLTEIGNKMGKAFDIIWMKKLLSASNHT